MSDARSPHGAAEPDRPTQHIAELTIILTRIRFEHAVKGAETLVLRLAVEQHRNRRSLCVELLRTIQEVPCSSGCAT